MDSYQKLFKLDRKIVIVTGAAGILNTDVVFSQSC